MIKTGSIKPFAWLATIVVFASCIQETPVPPVSADTDSSAVVIIGKENHPVPAEPADGDMQRVGNDGRQHAEMSVTTDVGEVRFSPADSSTAHPQQEVEDAVSAVMSIIASSVKSGNWDTNVSE